MATFSKQLLSGSTNGKNIKVVATATPGTTIHTAVSGTTSFDEIFLFAMNSSASAVALNIEWGGTTSPDDLTTLTLPPQSGWIPIIAGWVLQNGLLVRAFAGSANVVVMNGYVNRIA